VKILILPKIKRQFINSDVKNVNDYIKRDNSFTGWVDGFINNGHQVFLIGSESFFLPCWFAYRMPFLYALLRKIIKLIKLSSIDRCLFSKQIARYTEKNDIDFIFTELNGYISPKIIKKYHNKIIVTQWFGIFPDMASKEILNNINEFDYVWAPGKFDDELIKFNINPKIFYFIGAGFNERALCHDFDQKYQYDICFIGGVDAFHSERIEYLEHIARNFDNAGFFGYGVENVPKNYMLRKKFKGGAVSVVVRKIISSSKIAINLNVDNFDRVKQGCNARTFEIAGCNGALQIAKYDKKIFDFFQDGIDLITFKTPDDMVEKIRYYLKNDEERKEIVRNAYLKSKLYTYTQKALMVEKILKAEGN